MNTLLTEFPGSVNRSIFDQESLSISNFVNGFNQNAFLDLSPDSKTSSDELLLVSSPDSTTSSEGGSSDSVVLKYISEILLEEDLQGKTCMLQDCLALQATEKSFYDALGQNYPPFNHCPSLSTTPKNLQDPPHVFAMMPVIPDESQEYESKGKRNYERSDSFLQGRNHKHSAISVEESEISEMFDRVLLCQNTEASTCGLLNPSPPIEEQKGKLQQKKLNARSRRSKKQGNNDKEIVDLSTLLTQCAQAVASYDQRTALDLIKQIRQHSSATGDGNQRLAHYFADGLEARIAGTGTPSYSPLAGNRISAAQILRAYHAYVQACPFKKLSFFYANRTILKVAEKAKKLHIIDFGIAYGFQWPCLIQRLSMRSDGPPKLCITGIELPQPGFRPTERVEETGRRLMKYCERFNVPFEYKVIAQKWETIKYEDLKINRDEMIVVNCLQRLKNIPDDTVAANSPRETVLKLIRQINPDIFIHGVSNGTYNSPFFVTRFREALFHFSAQFDMFDATVPRDCQARMDFEKEVLGRDVVNVIACEGMERVERPETYKQWQVKNLRAGFKQLPLDEEIMKKVRSMVKSDYHGDYVVDADGNWMLQGWKGRIVLALSCWKPIRD